MLLQKVTPSACPRWFRGDDPSTQQQQ